MAKKTTEIRPRLSRIDFYRHRGSDFFEALYRCIDRELGEDRQRLKRWSRLNTLQQGLHAWRGFLGDVLNGGLVQYFYNHTDVLVPALVEPLEASGCQAMSAIVQQAADIYREHAEEFATESPFGENGLFARMTELAKLDRTLVRQLNRAGKQLEKWVRAQIAQIALGDDGEPIDPSFSGTIETHHPGGQVFEQAVVRRGVLSGPYRRYLEDGTLEHSCYYKAGEISSDYWPNGQPRRKTLKRGKLTVNEWYYLSGNIQKRLVADGSDNAVEPVRLWHENGQLAEELHVKGGKKLGPWLKFFDDGLPRLEAEYRKGETLVVKNAWDDRRRQVVKDGDGTYFDDGRDIDASYRLVFEGDWTHSRQLRGGVRHGVETTWFEGVLWSTQEFAEGKPHGLQTLFYDNGRVRTKATYRNGKEVKTEAFPKFDDPRPAVLLEVEANAELYRAWNHPLLDAYPTPLNLEEVQAQLEFPEFLEQVFERNKAGKLEEDDEDLNDFDDTIAYMVMVDERGIVDKVDFSGCSPYSIGTVDRYPPIIRQLTFEPGRIGGREVRCRVVVSVHHTFAEASSGRPA
jgi:antitoxin component YwqK of YwqJK toxin-antitoxin module